MSNKGRTRCQSVHTDWVQVNEFIEDKWLYRCGRLEGHEPPHRGWGKRVRREDDWYGVTTYGGKRTGHRQ
jgi:hypothetical protein